MHLHLWSDVVCPWCYVGKRRLERALTSFLHADAVELVHRSFQLNPAAPRGQTQSRREMLKAKYRLTDTQVQAMDADMAATAAVEGLAYTMQDGVTGNTADAHRLLHLARASGRQDALLARFYRAYFAEGRSLFEAAVLAELAEGEGLDRDEIRRVLESDAYAGAVAADQEQARGFGVTGVPFLLVAGRYAVSGAQPPEALVRVLERAWREAAHDTT